MSIKLQTLKAKMFFFIYLPTFIEINAQKISTNLLQKIKINVYLIRYNKIMNYDRILGRRYINYFQRSEQKFSYD